MAELSLQSQIALSNLELTSKLMQGLNNVSKTETSKNQLTALKLNKNGGKFAYATKGDARYKKEIDTDNDGIVTYNEYVKYITENLSEKNNIPKSLTSYTNEEDAETGLLTFKVTNLRKALISYINNASNLPVSLIEEEV